eukprot:01419_6
MRWIFDEGRSPVNFFLHRSRSASRRGFRSNLRHIFLGFSIWTLRGAASDPASGASNVILRYVSRSWCPSKYSITLCSESFPFFVSRLRVKCSMRLVMPSSVALWNMVISRPEGRSSSFCSASARPGSNNSSISDSGVAWSIFTPFWKWRTRFRSLSRLFAKISVIVMTLVRATSESISFCTMPSLREFSAKSSARLLRYVTDLLTSLPSELRSIYLSRSI